tara:strand:- start:1534 stop:1971 length:438 start_codon:yes stop_codon:yes gene_type:complete
MDKEVYSYIDYTGHIGKIRTAQDRNLNLLFQTDRLMRMEENETLNGSAAYSLDRLFLDTRTGMFGNGKSNVDAVKRGAQRAYVEKMKDLLESDDDQVMRSDIQPMVYGHLTELKELLSKSKNNNRSMKYHNAELVNRIDEILDKD